MSSRRTKHGWVERMNHSIQISSSLSMDPLSNRPSSTGQAVETAGKFQETHSDKCQTTTIEQAGRDRSGLESQQSRDPQPQSQEFQTMRRGSWMSTQAKFKNLDSQHDKK
ncbi:hypothetical protein E6O75_ATG05011 [Venturia nashicola]|uniref:Uncharacterized protein n=1 Tax=Venturia nashicola TaxID=86259 RepID=A0A4Z1PA87_9PEZI|nr:hypothetical protein E6O75_ATG05011 [Venturia nashicola]